VHEDDAVFGCKVDHIISEKHGGATAAENLAYACAFCNRAKGSDLGSIVQGTGTYVRFFNPRIDRWAEHFTLDGVTIVPLSDIGEVTARILDFNNSDRLLERQVLLDVGRYPSAAAVARMASDT
jgi:HNH endonuclease